MEDSHSPQYAHATSRLLFLAIGILIVLAVLAILLVRLSQPKEPSIIVPENEETTPPQANQVLTTTPPRTPEPAVILIRYGTISRITASEIYFESMAFNSTTTSYEMVELAAQITNDTTFTQVDRTQPLVPPAPGSTRVSAYLPAVMEFSGLEPGNTIEVFAAENVKGETRFPAVEIRKHILP